MQRVFFEESRFSIVFQRKRFPFELFFCLANAGFFTFSPKTRSIITKFRLQTHVGTAEAEKSVKSILFGNVH